MEEQEGKGSYEHQRYRVRRKRNLVSSSCLTSLGTNSFARKSFLAFLADVSEETGRVPAVEIDVTKHGVSTIRIHVIDGICKWTSKFFEGIAANVGWVIWSFALACDDCVILLLKIYRTGCTTLQTNLEIKNMFQYNFIS